MEHQYFIHLFCCHNFKDILSLEGLAQGFAGSSGRWSVDFLSKIDLMNSFTAELWSVRDTKTVEVELGSKAMVKTFLKKRG